MTRHSLIGGVDAPRRAPARPEVFLVDEVPLYPDSGEGAHTFVRVEKRGRTTEEVVRAIARAAGVAARDVGVAGRKDRVAVSRQWLSVPDLDPELALGLTLPDARVLEAVRHPHKLRTGHLAGNRFVLQLGRLDDEAVARARGRLARFEREGFPNLFGAQRFGRHGDNIEAGLRIWRNGSRGRDRRQARFLVSALQAAVFNEALALRPVALSQLESGDVAVVHASGGLFRVDDVDREGPRAARFEISATGPIFGSRVHPAPEGAVAEREVAALERIGLGADEALRAPRGIRARGGRRPLRVRPDEPEFDASDDGGWELRVRLGPGTYVSVLAGLLLAPVSEADPPPPIRLGDEDPDRSSAWPTSR